MLRPTLAALLAVLLLALGFLAANGPLHHAWQHHDATGGSGCAICLFAKGHLDLPDTTPVPGPVIFLLLGSLPAMKACVPESIDLLLPPGRAPPGCLSPIV